MPQYHVHMRDQKANQNAMLNRRARQAMVNFFEEITVVIVIWGVYLITKIQ